MFLTTDDESKANGELASLAENFREQAAVLVDMLDISIPTVAKLKVKTVKIAAVYTIIVALHANLFLLYRGGGTGLQ